MNDIYEGIYIDASVSVAAQTTLEVGTVLGEITASNILTPYKSDATDGSKVPCYVLAQQLTNTSDSAAATFTNVRVLAGGFVPAGTLKLTKSGDTLAAIKTTLKNNGIFVVDVANDVVLSSSTNNVVDGGDDEEEGDL